MRFPSDPLYFLPIRTKLHCFKLDIIIFTERSLRELILHPYFNSCSCFSIRTPPGQSSVFDPSRRSGEEEGEENVVAIVIPSDSDGKLP